jgi:hypothetical protein
MIVTQAKHAVLVGQPYGANKPQTPASPWHGTYDLSFNLSTLLMTFEKNAEIIGAGGRGAGGRGAGGAMGPPMGGRGHVAARDPLLSATVRITQGPYKGCWGIVEGVIENSVRVELASVMKTITVPRTSVKPFDNIKPGYRHSIHLHIYCLYCHRY